MASTKDTSLDHAVKLDIPNEEYYLTTWDAGDTQDVIEIMSIDAVNHNLIAVPKPYKLSDATFWTDRQLATSAALLAPSSTTQERKAKLFAQGYSTPVQVIRHGGPEGKFVGCVSLTPKAGTETVELGYYLHPAHQGRGLMAVAAMAAIRCARELFEIRRVYSSADCMNPASQKTIEKVSAATAVGEVETGTKKVDWGDVKVVEGREKESLARTWEWSV